MNKRNISMYALEIILQFIMFLTVAVIVCFGPLSYQSDEYWRCLMVVIPAAAAWYLRHRKISNRRFYLCHAFLLIAAFLAGRNDNERFFYCILMLLLIFYSSYVMYKNERPDKERPTYFVLVIMVAGLIAGKNSQNEVIINTSLATAALFVILAVIYDNIFSISLVFSENKNTVNFPDRQFLAVNRYIMFITVVVMLAVMALMSEAGNRDFSFLGEFGIVIGRAAATFIIWLIELLGKLQGKTVESQERPEGDASDELLGYFTEGNGDGSIEKIINAVIIVAAVIIIAAIITALIKVINRYMRRDHIKQEGNDTIEFIKKGESKSRIPSEKKRREASVSTDNEQFRKLYKRYAGRGMRRLWKGEIPVSMTPTDITIKGIVSDESEAEEITRAYEIARYSEASVTKDDIKNLKKRKNKGI